MRRSATRARASTLVLLSIVFGIALVLFPMRTKGARGKRPNPAASASASASAAPASSAAPVAPPSVAKVPSAAPASTPHAAAEANGRTIPMGKGLPVSVTVGVFFLEVKSFDDSKNEFESTTDVRMRWTDLRHQYSAAEAIHGYKEYRGAEADAQLATMWVPHVDITNRLGEPSFQYRRLRIHPYGQVETMTRTTARYTAHVDAQSFPFDRQHLTLDMVVRDDITDDVLLDYRRDEVEFSRHAPGMEISGWNPGLVNLHGETISGWNGDRYSRVTASLDVDREASSGIAPIFIPLVASLLIPMLAVWMNKVDHENGFAVDAFELANIIIGGLFSVIALSFAIYSSYGVIAGGDNTVTRLFALNYTCLAMALLVVILFFRYNLPRRLWGPYVQEQLFLFASWALPLLTVGTSIAFLLIAAA